MNEPNRLLDSDESALTKTLISAARDEQPSSRSLHRTLLAVGAGAAVLGASAAAGGAAVGASSSMLKLGTATSFGMVVKWLGIGAVAGLVTAGAAVQLDQRTASRPQAVASASMARVELRASEAERAPALQPAPAVAEEPEPSPAKPAARALSQPSAPSQELVEDDPSLNAEVAALDRARRSIASGNAERALTELGAYDREFSGGRLGPEALFLRMEASLGRGDRAAAERAARQLLAEHPKSPHAARARAVLAGAAKNP